MFNVDKDVLRIIIQKQKFFKYVSQPFIGQAPLLVTQSFHLCNCQARFDTRFRVLESKLRPILRHRLIKYLQYFSCASYELRSFGDSTFGQQTLEKQFIFLFHFSFVSLYLHTHTLRRHVAFRSCWRISLSQFFSCLLTLFQNFSFRPGASSLTKLREGVHAHKVKSQSTSGFFALDRPRQRRF